MKFSEATKELKEIKEIDIMLSDMYKIPRKESYDIAIEALQEKAELEMALEELMEKYKQNREVYIIGCNLGDSSRLKCEAKLEVLADVISDLYELV